MKEIQQELDFIYITSDGKKFISKKRAIDHQKKINSKIFNFF